MNYATKDLERIIKDFFTKEIENNWNPNNDIGNVSLLENTIAKTINMIIYNAVLYKNPGFNEEKEWRLVFDPFRRIRRISKLNDYLDRMCETFVRRKQEGGFIQNALSFKPIGETIISYIDLDFKQVKNELIKEIIIGPKANIDDNDLRLFLYSNGYEVSSCGLSLPNVVIRKSSSTYR